MQKTVIPRQGLRARRAVYVPSWGKPCGVSAYAAAILEEIPTDSRPCAVSKMRSHAKLDLLQVEHQNLLFNDDELAYELMSQRDRGTTVIVTEHSVSQGERSFEFPADVLVALTDLGVEAIRARWKNKPVVRVNHGCPTWFPPRKRARGAVIGAFGFLEKHKGFEHILDSLRALPGTELLLFSHAKSSAAEAAWAARCAGLPVRWERAYLPSVEIARRLAVEADVIVFWYADMPHVSASGAVRVALATGVPVLTSNTKWFADLAEVTYQPHSLVEGIRQILSDTALRQQVTESAREFCHRYTWRRTAGEYSALWKDFRN